ncbi:MULTISPECIES: alpha/beta fold hydrolase [unclassified Sphingopyxis]|jgi:pimeloyl-ACP methyl ester carboxylesterase|uniref:alpha/beta fold hydrolase n=1 Tax=unclassified Sphingopyxis TaxID=2614943 RepID=UPI0006C0AAD8|nr:MULTISPECIES: alpha/beta hydrolase [unclassified Sphingopyxis]USI75714.1 alpha/beta hydrolase [Sphingopyxis sp. USTB-05]GAO77766.1 alpha/beta hydrolase fold [Sphingopyxis sp. C-1]
MIADDMDFDPPPPPRRPFFRRKRVLIPLALLVTIVVGFLLLLTPDTDRDAMIAKYSGPAGAFVAGPAGQRIHYRDQGKRGDRAIILIHGANASLHTWEPLVKRLGETYRVVTLDLPGHGLTGAIPDTDYSAQGMMDAVDVVAAKLGLDHFILGGNSMGGWVAWRYALAQPARVDALLLIDAAGMPLRPGEKRPESNVGFRVLEYPFGRWLATRVTPRMLVEQSLRGSVEKQEIVDDAMIDRYWELLRFPGNRAATVLRARMDREPAMAARVGEIKAPTLILFGDKDRLINPSAAKTFNERIAGSEVVILPGIGHLPMEEAPDATANAIADFLTRRLVAPSAPDPETR